MGFKRDWKSIESHDAPALYHLCRHHRSFSQFAKCHGRGSLLPQTRLFKTDQCWSPYALGQSFFALSLGVTAMLTYASYLDQKTNLVQSGISIVAMNISVSIMAGLAIFPAMSAFNIQSEGGPSLLFIVSASALWQDAFWNHFLHPSSSCSSSLRRSLLLSLCWKSMWQYHQSGQQQTCQMECYFRNFDLCLWNPFSPILQYYGRCSHFLGRPSLMLWTSWFPISLCHLELSAFHFLQAISLKGSCNGGTPSWWNSMETGTVPSLALPSSFHHSNHHHRGLHRLIYVIKRTWVVNSGPFFYGWLTINSKPCPSNVQASTSLGRIKWLPFGLDNFSVNS